LRAISALIVEIRHVSATALNAPAARRVDESTHSRAQRAQKPLALALAWNHAAVYLAGSWI
jgi:hypothetical protein